jgi:alpha-galactosidase/6-phospho-beta-glucosidase family protein
MKTMWENPEWITAKQYKPIQEFWVRHYQDELDKQSFWGSQHVRFVKIQEHYHQGRLMGRLHLMDFKQFNLRMTKNDYNFYYRKHWSRDRLRNHYIYNRNGKKNPRDYSEKKVLSEKEIAKREWREFKQVRKDNAKAYPYWRARKSSCVRPAIKACRRYVRQKLSKGDYDIDVDYKFSFSDPWDWR